MEITLFTKDFRHSDSIAHFMDFYYSLQLRYLASDLLNEGLTPNQINDAVVKAMGVGKSSGMNLCQHFRPVFSGVDKEIIIDCKLSHLAYGLVVLNADVELSLVGNFQVSVLEEFLRSQ
ncbi:hypothetical protein ACOCEA_13765 [Maribacter sp. CXY002]|uniref:hypothetical protein n=1 Tax=Maribacter luteocoastalis TaxID=3407671 RepID=UPI003B681D17